MGVFDGLFGQSKEPKEGPHHSCKTAYGERHALLDRAPMHPVESILNAMYGGAVQEWGRDIEYAPVGPEVAGIGRTYSGAVAVAQFVDRAGQPAPITRAPEASEVWVGDPIGSMAWSSAWSGKFVIVYIFGENTSDEGVYRRATESARKRLNAWLTKHDLAPREYRPKKFSEGFIVPAEQPLWVPHPRAGSNPFPVRAQRWTYDSHNIRES